MIRGLRGLAHACIVSLVAVSCQASAPATLQPAETKPSRANPQPEPTADMNPYEPPWSVVVSDGSGNVYACAHAEGGAPHCDYDPVTPAQSSTGHYSGGDPWDVVLSPEQVEGLWRTVEAAMRDTAGHTDSRDKTTVAVDAKRDATTSFILDADAGAALVQFLTSLRPASAAPPGLQ
jgi:hypothetical protein